MGIRRHQRRRRSRVPRQNTRLHRRDRLRLPAARHDNPSSVLSCIIAARSNARMVRTALTREAWESVNVAWLNLKTMLAEPVAESLLPRVLHQIKRETANILGSFHGTMLRNEIFNFASIGTYMERADSTARILDVKYYVLLPAVSYVGTSLDNHQWESILRSVSAHRSYRWVYGVEYQADEYRRLSHSERSDATLAPFLLQDDHPEPGASRGRLRCENAMPCDGGSDALEAHARQGGGYLRDWIA